MESHTSESPESEFDDAFSSAVADTEASQKPVTASGWSALQCVLFRFLLIYYVLYAFPGPLDNLLYTGAGVIREVATAMIGDAGEANAWIQDTPLRWAAKWGHELGQVERARQATTSWLDERGLAPYEVIHQRTGSGDTGHDIAMCLVNVLLALLLVGLWSWLRRRRPPGDGYPRLGRWLHLVVRFDLAFWLLSYGSFKLYGSQFGELSLTRLTQDIGDTWPMTMVGTFMQANPPYEVFGGVGEVVAGLLLFHRRTALLGALLSIAVMGQVCALNWLCGVPVKLFSMHLLLYAIFLLLPWRHALLDLLIRNRSTRPVDMRVPVWRGLRWTVIVLGWLWVLATLFNLHVQSTAPRPWMQGREKSELYGLWMVERMQIDGVEVPKSDASRWRFLAIDRGKRAWTRDANETRTELEFVWDGKASVAQVKPRRGNAPATPWTLEQGTKTVPVDPPLLLRNEDRGKRVDGERRTLRVTGTWKGKPFELFTVEKRFRLKTGFRLRQELPDFW